MADGTPVVQSWSYGFAYSLTDLEKRGSRTVATRREVRSNVVATQVELHAKYRGVVPEIASRAHIENILPVLEECMSSAACGLADLDAIAVAHRPGLIGSLLIGVTAAKSLAWSLGKPLIAVDHVHAHLYSVLLEKTGTQLVSFPAVGMVCSGGHTAIYDVRGWDDVILIGTTIDDAVGEAYDKVAAIMGLGYPGGPIIDKLAAQGDPKAVEFPRTYLRRESLDFSFSGLKTAVLYHVRGVPGQGGRDKPGATMTDQHVRDVCASFQAPCVDVITKKLQRALKQTGGMSVIFVVPVFGVLWGALFLNEAIHLSTVLGGAVILFSVFLIVRTLPRPRRGDRCSAWSSGPQACLARPRTPTTPRAAGDGWSSRSRSAPTSRPPRS